MKRVFVLILLITLSFTLTSCFTISKGEDKALSAYEIALENGFVGTEAEWLESLKGEPGKSLTFAEIYSAAVEEGYDKDILSFVKEYFGDVPIYGESAFELAVKNGFEGTMEEWLASLKGEAGPEGEKGDSIDLYAVFLELKRLEEIPQDTMFLEFVQDYLKVNVNVSNQEVISKAILSAVKVVSTNDELYINGVPNDKATGKSGAGVLYKMNKEVGSSYIITNYHVVYDNDETKQIMKNIHVNLIGDQYLKNSIKATYVGGSATYDIAVLYIKDDLIKTTDAQGITAFDSNTLVAGTTAIAIGNPQGEGIAVTQGIVSVDSEKISMDPISDATDVIVNEKGKVEMRVIRIDTPINSGNSGGGLFNDKGELIGIVNAKIKSSTVANIGYAIPSNIVINVADNLIRNNKGVSSKVVKCVIGCVVSVDSSYAAYDPMTNKTYIYENVMIDEVLTTSVAYGKLMKGDILKSITLDGVTYDITRSFVIMDICLKAEVFSTVKITVLRGDVLHTYEVKLSNYMIIG